MKFKKLDPLIASMFDTTVWGARVGKYSFVIGHNETGYVASYKDREFEGKQSSRYIENSLERPFNTYIDAEKACKRKWKELRKH